MENQENLNQSEKRDNAFLKQVIQVMKDIKSLAETYPTLKIAVKLDYSEIKISKEFESKFEMKLNRQNNGYILSSHNLPDRITLLRCGMPTTLKRAIESCSSAIESLTEFYETLETIDHNSMVVMPPQPTSKDNFRIIRFSKNLYVKIELVNPMNVNDAQVSFYGKTELVEKISDLYSQQEQNGNEDNVFWRLHYTKYDLDEQEMDDKERIDCGICFEFYNEHDQCPLIFCDNQLCTQAFHANCLNQLLKSSTKVLNVSVGECPYCKFKIQANFIKDEESDEEMK